MRRTLAAAAFTLLLAALPLAAEAPPPPPALADLSWLSGSWAGENGGTHNEEHWTAAEGGLMLGMHRDLQGGRVVFFEFLRIEATGDGLRYVAMPRGRGETAFPLAEMTARRVVFANPEHDSPQRIVYWQEAPGELRARVEGTIDGRQESEEWRWRRSALPTS